MSEKVVVFGYSENPERYSFKAYNLLKQFDHDAVAFNPRLQNISEISFEFDTLTMYVGEAVSSSLLNQISDLNFKRIIFNPGSENPKLEEVLKSKGREVVHGCTLVMLKTDQF